MLPEKIVALTEEALQTNAEIQSLEQVTDFAKDTLTNRKEEPIEIGLIEKTTEIEASTTVLPKEVTTNEEQLTTTKRITVEQPIVNYEEKDKNSSSSKSQEVFTIVENVFQKDDVTSKEETDKASQSIPIIEDEITLQPDEKEYELLREVLQVPVELVQDTYTEQLVMKP